MTKKQPLWGTPKGDNGFPQKETPTQGSEGDVIGVYPAGLSPIIPSKYDFVKKIPQYTPFFIFIIDL